jgi:hypothetical protein
MQRQSNIPYQPLHLHLIDLDSTDHTSTHHTHTDRDRDRDRDTATCSIHNLRNPIVVNNKTQKMSAPASSSTNDHIIDPYYGRSSYGNTPTYHATGTGNIGTGGSSSFADSGYGSLHRKRIILKTLIWHVLNICILGAAFGIAVGVWDTQVELRVTTFSMIDPSIQAPVEGDTIKYQHLIAIVLVVPFVLYMIYGLVDSCRHSNPRWKKDWPFHLYSSDVYSHNDYTPYDYSFSGIWIGWLWWIGTLQSLAIAILLTEWTKRYSDHLVGAAS